MELHNVLIGGWYLLQPLFVIMYMIRGYFETTEASTLLNGLILAGLTASIFATGDPSSWQAVFLMIWWALGVLYNFTNIGKKVWYDGGLLQNISTFLVTCLIILPFFLLGINIPSGV